VTTISNNTFPTSEKKIYLKEQRKIIRKTKNRNGKWERDTPYNTIILCMNNASTLRKENGHKLFDSILKAYFGNFE